MFDPRSLIEALTANKVKFIIVGGVAANLHGAARVTFDLDICYERSEDNLRSLEAALSKFHPRLRGNKLPETYHFSLMSKQCEMVSISHYRLTQDQ